MGTLATLTLASLGVVGLLLVVSGLLMSSYARRFEIRELSALGRALALLGLANFLGAAAIMLHPPSDALLLSGVGPFSYGDVSWASLETGEVWASGGGAFLLAASSGLLLVAVSLIGGYAVLLSGLSEAAKGMVVGVLVGLGVAVALFNAYIVNAMAKLTVAYLSLHANPIDLTVEYDRLLALADTASYLKIAVVLASTIAASALYYSQYKAIGVKGDLYTSLGLLLLGLGYALMLFQSTSAWVSGGTTYTAALGLLAAATLLQIAGVALVFTGTRSSLKAVAAAGEGEEAE